MTINELPGYMYRQGLLDERRRMTYGTMTCYQGEFRCIAGIKGNTLCIFNSDKQMKLGELRMEFTIPNLSVTKLNSFFLFPKLEFDYAGRHYALKDFLNVTEFLTTFKTEYNRK